MKTETQIQFRIELCQQKAWELRREGVQYDEYRLRGWAEALKWVLKEEAEGVE